MGSRAASTAAAALRDVLQNRAIRRIEIAWATGTAADWAFLVVLLVLVYDLAALVAGAGSLVRPIQTALLPAFAHTPGELVAANVASSTGEGVGTFLGPLLAGVLVAWTGSAAASLLVAVAFAGAAAVV